MVYKLRDVMGKRDARYSLHGDVGISEGCFFTETPEDQRDCLLKRGCGSQRKTTVLVMVGSGFPKISSSKKRGIPKVVGHMKREVIDDLKASTETPKIQQVRTLKIKSLSCFCFLNLSLQMSVESVRKQKSDRLFCKGRGNLMTDLGLNKFVNDQS